MLETEHLLLRLDLRAQLALSGEVEPALVREELLAAVEDGVAGDVPARLRARRVTQLLLGDTPTQEPAAHHERHVDGLTGATLRRVDDELGIPDEVAGVSVLNSRWFRTRKSQ